MKETLNGYWTSKADATVTVYVEKVFKKGHVTGFSYKKTDSGEQIGEFRASHEELLSDYVRKGSDA